jgi:hypothetical protein
MGHKERVSIIEKYNRWSLSLMLLKCYHYSHPMAEFKVECANQVINAESNLIFLTKF